MSASVRPSARAKTHCSMSKGLHYFGRLRTAYMMHMTRRLASSVVYAASWTREWEQPLPLRTPASSFRSLHFWWPLAGSRWRTLRCSTRYFRNFVSGENRLFEGQGVRAFGNLPPRASGWRCFASLCHYMFGVAKQSSSRYTSVIMGISPLTSEPFKTGLLHHLLGWK